MLYLPGFYYVKKPKRFVILCSDKSSERNLSCFFDMRKSRKMEHLHKEEPFSSDPYFSVQGCTARLCILFFGSCINVPTKKVFLIGAFISTSVHYSISAKYEGPWFSAPNHSSRPCDTQCLFDLDPIMYLSFNSNKI